MTKIKRSTKVLLTEALDTIAATYWVQGDEYRLYEESGPMPDKRKDVLINTARFPDAQHTFVKDDQEHVAVVGVCSVGALALAEMTLYEVPIASYAGIRDRDVYVLGAERALAHEVLSRFSRGEVARNMSVVTDWNDDDNTTRKEVLEVFEAAVRGPLATATKIWGWPQFGGSWATKGAAMKFRSRYNKERKKVHTANLPPWANLAQWWSDFQTVDPLIRNAFVAFAELANNPSSQHNLVEPVLLETIRA